MTAQEWLDIYDSQLGGFFATDYEKYAAAIIRSQQEQIERLTAECQKWQEYHDAEYRERKKYRHDANYFAGEVDRLRAELREREGGGYVRDIERKGEL